MSTPYIGFGNDSLSKLPTVKPGDEITCPECGARHKLETPDGGSTLVMFYKCGDGLYLGAVDGRCTVGVKSDVSGNI